MNTNHLSGGWELFTMPNGHLSCENHRLATDDTDRVEAALEARFGEAMKREHVMVAFDNWSGVFIMQALIREIPTG